MAVADLEPIARFTVDSLQVHVYEDRALAGRAAAQAVALAIRERQQVVGQARVVFAAAPSQNEFLAGLVASKEIDWSRLVAFHMDEYLGMQASHPASFRRYLQERLFGLVGLEHDQLRLIPGERAARPLETCLEYENLLLAEPADIVCAGIGENGHLAFNDPPVAEFDDPRDVKVVELDPACRRQQVGEGHFASIDAVPTHAMTVTVPALLRARAVAAVVPEERKAVPVRDALLGPVTTACPASALRTAAGATLYLDAESASLLPTALRSAPR
jgi:glucosamine-6-phosphate deaminase